MSLICCMRHYHTKRSICTYIRTKDEVETQIRAHLKMGCPTDPLSFSAWSTICCVLEQLPISCSSSHRRRRPELSLCCPITKPIHNTTGQHHTQTCSPIHLTKRLPSPLPYQYHMGDPRLLHLCGGEGAGWTVAGCSSPDTATGHRLLLLPECQLAESRQTPPFIQTMMV